RLGGRPTLKRRHSMLPQHPRAFGTGRRGRGQQVNGEGQGCRSYSHHRSTSRGQLLPERPAVLKTAEPPDLLEPETVSTSTRSGTSWPSPSNGDRHVDTAQTAVALFPGI